MFAGSFVQFMSPGQALVIHLSMSLRWRDEADLAKSMFEVVQRVKSVVQPRTTSKLAKPCRGNYE